MTQHEINARINELNAQAEALLGKLRQHYGDEPTVSKSAPDPQQLRKQEISEAVSETLQSFKRGCACPHSVLFDQLLGEFDIDSGRNVAGDPLLIPLCRKATLLDSIKLETGKRPCPFYHDLDPQNGAARYQIGELSSHRCDYSDYLAAKGPIPRIVNHLSAWIVAAEPQTVPVESDKERISA